ncbi:MAG: HD domain-containing phosphohydrolase [Glaciecola sp.]
MAVFTPEELDGEILNDLREEILELYEASEQTLVELELRPQDKELQRALFRSVHTIKGDLGLVGFTPMVEVLQYMEDILDMLRKGEMAYSSLLSDLVLKLMDKVNRFVDNCIKHTKAEYDKQAIDATIAVIKKFTPSNSKQHDTLFTQAIQAINGGSITEAPTQAKIVIPKTGIPQNISEDQQHDLLFFRELMRPIEKRCGYPEGRGDKIASLALYINSLHPTPLPEVQLAVACYVHDFGLAFMPENVVNKPAALTDLEANLLRSHVYKSTRLIEHLTQWNEAHKMIMHHHENIDGSGYPLGITGDKISEGAKLLGILDRYVTLTTKAQKNGEVMNEVEAVIAINKNYKGQLSGGWLRLFNKGMTDYLNQ